MHGAVPTWDYAVARAAVALALNRQTDEFGAVLFEPEPEPEPEPDYDVPIYASKSTRSQRAAAACRWLGHRLVACACVQQPSAELRHLGDQWLSEHKYNDAAEAYAVASEAERWPPYVADLHHKRAVRCCQHRMSQRRPWQQHAGGSTEDALRCGVCCVV